MNKQQIKSDDPSYFAMIPHLATDTMNPYQLALYVHYKRVAGTGTCFESVRTTAKNTQMSIGKVVSTRDELVKLGWITITMPETSNNPKETIVIEVLSKWKENRECYDNKNQRSRDEQSVQVVNSGVHEVNTEPKPTVHEVNQRIYQEKEEYTDKNKDHAVANANGANGKTPPNKPLTEYQQFTQKLADICGEDMEIKSIAKKIGVNAAELWRANYKIPDLERFEKWWYVNDWRGKKRQKPNLTNVKSLIKQATQVAKIEPIPDKPAQSTFPPGLKPYHLMEKDKQHG